MDKINNKVKALLWAFVFAAPYGLAFLIGAVWAAFNMEKLHELKQLGDEAFNNHLLTVFEPWVPIFTVFEWLYWVPVVYVFVKLWKKK